MTKSLSFDDYCEAWMKTYPRAIDIACGATFLFKPWQQWPDGLSEMFEWIREMEDQYGELADE